MIRLTLDELPKEIQERLLGTARVIAGPALRAGAHACQAVLATRTPVYTGQLKAGWTVGPIPGSQDGWKVSNATPYMGVIEAGARPHPVGREGIEALTRWFELKGTKPQPPKLSAGSAKRRGGKKRRGVIAFLKRALGFPGGKGRGRRAASSKGGGGRKKAAPMKLSHAEARAAAFAFANRLKKKGWPGTFFVRKSLPRMEALSRHEVRRHLERYARRSAGQVK